MTPPSQSKGLKDWLLVNGRRLGLLEIGYHFLIMQDGKLLETRPHAVQGSHWRGANETTIGVALAGGQEEGPTVYGSTGPEDNFTEAQWETFGNLMGALRDIYKNPSLPIWAHSAQCPPTTRYREFNK
jgi:N-acetyl-anhydromuramyl-L-alanine amidase AmpD